MNPNQDLMEPHCQKVKFCVFFHLFILCCRFYVFCLEFSKFSILFRPDSISSFILREKRTEGGSLRKYGIKAFSDITLRKWQLVLTEMLVHQHFGQNMTKSNHKHSQLEAKRLNKTVLCYEGGFTDQCLVKTLSVRFFN